MLKEEKGFIDGEDEEWIFCDSAPKHLILGCGHGKNCGYCHPPESFITVDLNGHCQADVVCDPSKVDSLSQALTQKSFTYIIFEYFPFSNNEAMIYSGYVEKLLAKTGYIIVIGGNPQIIKQLRPQQAFWSWQSPSYQDKQIMIIPHPEMKSVELQLDPGIKDYLYSHLRLKIEATTFKQHHYNKTVDGFIENLEKHKNFIDTAISRPSSHTSCLAIFNFLDCGPRTQDITVKEIKSLINSYNPGMIRKNLTGKTRAILELDNCLRGKHLNEELTIEDLIKIKKINDRRITRLNSWYYDPSRSNSGESARIFQQINVLILYYLVSNIGQFNGDYLSRITITRAEEFLYKGEKVLGAIKKRLLPKFPTGKFLIKRYDYHHFLARGLSSLIQAMLFIIDLLHTKGARNLFDKTSDLFLETLGLDKIKEKENLYLFIQNLNTNKEMPAETLVIKNKLDEIKIQAARIQKDKAWNIFKYDLLSFIINTFPDLKDTLKNLYSLKSDYEIYIGVSERAEANKVLLKIKETLIQLQRHLASTDPLSPCVGDLQKLLDHFDWLYSEPSISPQKMEEKLAMRTEKQELVQSTLLPLLVEYLKQHFPNRQDILQPNKIKQILKGVCVGFASNLAKALGKTDLLLLPHIDLLEKLFLWGADFSPGKRLPRDPDLDSIILAIIENRVLEQCDMLAGAFDDKALKNAWKLLEKTGDFLIIGSNYPDSKLQDEYAHAIAVVKTSCADTYYLVNANYPGLFTVAEDSPSGKNEIFDFIKTAFLGNENLVYSLHFCRFGVPIVIDKREFYLKNLDIEKNSQDIVQRTVKLALNNSGVKEDEFMSIVNSKKTSVPLFPPNGLKPLDSTRSTLYSTP